MYQYTQSSAYCPPAPRLVSSPTVVAGAAKVVMSPTSKAYPAAVKVVTSPTNNDGRLSSSSLGIVRTSLPSQRVSVAAPVQVVTHFTPQVASHAQFVHENANQYVAKAPRTSVPVKLSTDPKVSAAAGRCPWQLDAGAFKQWVKTAVEVPGSAEHNQLYGFLTECFLDADGDRDGLVNVTEFDFLIEKAAKLPRRFGLAPNWSEMYSSIEERHKGRMVLFSKLDAGCRKAIGLEEWINWSFTHIAEKVQTMDMKSINWNALEAFGKDAFLEFCHKAVFDATSAEYKELYTFLFKSFVEADADQKGTITLHQFDSLIEKVAAAPRSLGLAPASSDMYENSAERQTSRKQLFDTMDVDRSGTITFDEFLSYTVKHITEKVQSAGSVPVVPGEQNKARTSGLRPWQVEKGAFKQWARSAVENPNGTERAELYNFLCDCFMDADSDKDGFVKQGEFDFLVEQAAALPRRFGLAPTWPEAYGSIEQRQEARAAMFAKMDTDRSGSIGLEEWVSFTLQHIAEKVQTMQRATVDFANLETVGTTAFLRILRTAVANRSSEEYKELYAFLYKNFVEADSDQKGAVTFEQFDVLVEKSARAPRSLGLAPTSDSMFPTAEYRMASRKQLFQAMDADASGTITFDEYLRYTMAHIAEKVNERSGGPDAKALARPPVSVSRCPYGFDRA